jgi:hypothetical protein
VVGHVVVSLQGIRISSEFNTATPSYSFTCGHYLDGLQGASDTILSHLKVAFESVYEMITQHLAVSTLAGDVSSQACSLSAWSIVVKAEDHDFLNRIGIFRVLQSVLYNSRAVTAAIASKHPLDYAQKLSDAEPLKVNLDLVSRFRAHPSGIYAVQFLVGSQKRLSHLVLSIVHWLASQVALKKNASSQSEVYTRSNPITSLCSSHNISPLTSRLHSLSHYLHNLYLYYTHTYIHINPT